MNYWKIIFASLVIFGAGVMAGGLVASHRSFHHRHDNGSSSDGHERMNREVPPPPLVARLGKQFLQQLDDKVQLTPDQRDKIAKIIADGQERNHEIWTNVAPQIRAEIQEVHRQIREQLGPEQREQFEELLKHPPRKVNSTNAPPVVPATTNAPSASAGKTPCV